MIKVDQRERRADDIKTVVFGFLSVFDIQHISS